MAVLTNGYTFGTTEQVTAAKLHTLVTSGTVTNIVNADLDSAAAIADSKLATISTAGKVSGTSLTSLSSIPSGAGLIPSANISSPANLTNGTQGIENLIRNGNFEDWTSGTSSAPDGWTYSGSTIARESTIIKIGTYSLKYTTTGAGEYADQTVSAAKGISYFKGRTVTLSAWVYASVASRVHLRIADGVSYDISSYHTGNSTWQYLTVTRTIDSSATYVSAQLYTLTGSATSVYFDGAILTEGSSSFSFVPYFAEEGVWTDYSATSTIVGWSSFSTKQIYIKKIGKTAFVQYSLVGTSNNTSASFTVPYPSSNTVSIRSLISNSNNGAAGTFGILTFAANDTIVTLCLTSAATDNGWTSSGSKYSVGQFFYQIA